MTGHGIGFDAERLGHDDRVEEYGGLRHAGLPELLVRAGEHDVRDAESEDFIGLLEQLPGCGNVVVEIFAHADGLSPLAGENVCVLHDFSEFFVSWGKDTNLFRIFAPQWFTKGPARPRVIKWECRVNRQQFPLL